MLADCCGLNEIPVQCFAQWVIAAAPYILVLKNNQSNFWVLSKKNGSIRCFKKYYWWLCKEWTVRGQK